MKFSQDMTNALKEGFAPIGTNETVTPKNVRANPFNWAQFEKVKCRTPLSCFKKNPQNSGA